MTTKRAITEITPTRYFGIYVQREGGLYCITDDNGGEELFGKSEPNPAAIDAYRAERLARSSAGLAPVEPLRPKQLI